MTITPGNGSTQSAKETKHQNAVADQFLSQ